jgi:hypothetical protein
LVIENLLLVIGEGRSENLAENAQFSGIALQCGGDASIEGIAAKEHKDRKAANRNRRN